MNSTAILRASAACLSLAMAGGLLLTAPAVRAQQVGAPTASAPGDETPRAIRPPKTRAATCATGRRACRISAIGRMTRPTS